MTSRNSMARLSKVAHWWWRTQCDTALFDLFLQAWLLVRRDQKGGKYCVYGGPGLLSCTNTYHVEGISMHKFPDNEGQRKLWVKFVRRHRPDFTATSSSVICSVHFEKSCSARRYQVEVLDKLKPRSRYLILGLVSTKDTIIQEERPMTSREKRLVSRVL